MRKIKNPEKLLFSDFKILGFDFNEKGKTLSINVDGAWLKTDSNSGKKMGNGTICFYSWKDFKIRKFDLKSNKWIEILLKNIEQIKDICKIEFSNKNVIINGFGTDSGLWIEYNIDSPLIEAFFEDL